MPPISVLTSIGSGNPGTGGWITAITNTSAETLNIQTDDICAA